MSNLSAETLMQVYPSVLERDAMFNALGQATAEALGAAFLRTANSSIYTRIAELDEGALNILAKDFNIAWYDYNYDLETKRRVVAAAFSVYFNNGTIGALKTALQAVDPYATVTEWFEYEGLPYCFRVVLNDPSVSFEDINRMIRLYKNERSHLDGISYNAQEITMPVYLGSADVENSMETESIMLE